MVYTDILSQNEEINPSNLCYVMIAFCSHGECLDLPFNDAKSVFFYAIIVTKKYLLEESEGSIV
ncbi:hypothetical protein JT05_02705 [Desulfosporosinus sp. Tol-M]|nr:hypothetical protein JT05_02705 [Desulfosporosinus sp. Tol-M]